MAEIIEKTGKSYNIFDKINNVWNKCSFWTHSNDVFYPDGKSATTKHSAINGITSDITGEAEDIAASIKCVNQLNSSLNNYNGYGSAIEVNKDNSYTVPDNGILFAKCNSGDQNYIYFTIDNIFPTGLTLAGTTSSTSMTVPIFKGQVVSISEQYGMAKLYFIPFTKTSN